MSARRSWCRRFFAGAGLSLSSHSVSTSSRAGLRTLVVLLVSWVALIASVAHAQTAPSEELLWWRGTGIFATQGEGPTAEAAADATIADRSHGPSYGEGVHRTGPCVFYSEGWSWPGEEYYLKKTCPIADRNGSPLFHIFATGRLCDPSNPAQTCQTDPSDPADPTNPTPHADKTIGQPNPGNGVGDPIDTATGNVYRHETDLQIGRWLSFTRTYNSQSNAAAGTLGPRWTHPWARSIRYQAGSNDTNDIARITLEDGKVITYVRVNDQWVGEADVADTLQWTHDAANQPTGWTLTRMATGTVDSYGAQGQLTSTTTADGFTLQLSYNAANQLTQITDPQRRSLTLTYDAQGRLQSVTAPDRSATVTYAYDAQGRLSAVVLPLATQGNEQRVYLYDEPAHTQAPASNRLTGVLDETGVRQATYDYQADGRAIGSALAAGTQAYTVRYNADGSSSTTDPLGTTVTRQYTEIAGVRHLSQLSGPCESCGKAAAITYGTNGQPTEITDFNGQRTTLAYDNALREIDRTEAVGTSAQRRILTTWADANRPTLREIRDANDHPVARTAWQYNARGQLLAQCEIDPAQTGTTTCAANGTPPAGVRRTAFTYCDAVDAVQCPVVGLTLTVTGPRTDVAQATTYSYRMTSSAVNCGAPGAVCYQAGDLYKASDALRQVTTIASYDANGRITRMTDANGIHTDLTYTPRGWLASRSVNGQTTTFTYTPYGAVQTTTDPDGVVTTFNYDTAHRLVKVTDALGNTIQYTLDVVGNKTAEQIYDAKGGLQKNLTRTFNPLGQLTKIVDGLNHTVFDASANGSYDVNGNLIQSTDGLGIQRKLGYDALSRLVQTIDNYNGTDSATSNTQGVVSFDALDRVDGVSDPDGLNTFYSHDGLGNLTQRTSPDSGSTRNTYDAAGNLVQSTDARGVTRTHTYDALNRVTRLSTGTASETVAYAYDEANAVTGCASSYPIGRLTRVVEQTVTTAYCYDAQGRVIQKRQIQGAQTDTLGYAYTPAGRLSGVVQPSGTQISYSRNSIGQVTAINMTTARGFKSTLARNISYLPFGPVASYTLGNGQTITRTYDGNYRLSGLTSPALTLRYARDAIGSVTSITVGSGSAAEYFYDPLNRLTSTKDANGSLLESYTYSKAGDRLSKTSSGSSAGTYSYQANTHWLTRIGSDTRSYDANGNTVGGVAAGETWGYGYDSYNRMTVLQRGGHTAATYTYNAFGERIAKAVTVPSEVNQRYVYNEAGQLVGEYGTDSYGSSNTNRDHIWLDDLPIAVLNKGDNASVINYVTADGLNTPRVLTSSTGTVIWNWPIKGNPFGDKKPVALSGYAYNLRFPGQYYDAESGLHYNVNRYYAPGTGRYRQIDPIGYDGGQWSLYDYVNSNPLGDVDPLGLQGVMGPLPSLPPFPTNMSDCQKNALANGVAQMIPNVGLFLTLGEKSFTPYGDGPLLSDSYPSEFDIMSGALGGTAGLGTSKVVDFAAGKYIDASYRNLLVGNRAYRRAVRSAQSTMWGGAKYGLGVVGKILYPIGIISAYIGAAEEARECGCGK
jgi:RHS repeat-associated protein